MADSSAPHTSSYYNHMEKTQRLLSRLEGYLVEREHRSQTSSKNSPLTSLSPDVHRKHSTTKSFFNEFNPGLSLDMNGIAGQSNPNLRLHSRLSRSNDNSAPVSQNGSENGNQSPFLNLHEICDPLKGTETASHRQSHLKTNSSVNWRLLEFRKRLAMDEHSSLPLHAETRGSLSTQFGFPDHERRRRPATWRDPVYHLADERDSGNGMSEMSHPKRDLKSLRSRSVQKSGAAKSTISSHFTTTHNLSTPRRKLSELNQYLCASNVVQQRSSNKSDISLRNSPAMSTNSETESAQSALHRRLNYSYSIQKVPNSKVTQKQLSDVPSGSELGQVASSRKSLKTARASTEISDSQNSLNADQKRGQALSPRSSIQKLSDTVPKKGFKSKLRQPSTNLPEINAQKPFNMSPKPNEGLTKVTNQHPDRLQNESKHVKQAETLYESRQSSRLQDTSELANGTAQTTPLKSPKIQRSTELQRRPVFKPNVLQRTESIKKGEPRKTKDIRTPIINGSEQNSNRKLNCVDRQVSISKFSDPFFSTTSTSAKKKDTQPLRSQVSTSSSVSSCRPRSASANQRLEGWHPYGKSDVKRSDKSEYHLDKSVETISLKLDRLTEHLVTLRRRVEKDYADPNSCSPGDDIFGDELIGALIEGKATGMPPSIANSLRNLRILEANVQDIYDLLYPNENQIWSPKT